MPRFFFPVDYGDFRCEDDTGEEFPSADEAANYAKIVADELSRNNTKSVTIFVVAADQAAVMQIVDAAE